MTNRKMYIFTLACITALLVCSCVSAPVHEKPQFTRKNYTFSVLFTPEKPKNSPSLDLALSLVQMEYPVEETELFHKVLYSTATLDEYKDRVILEQREMYRDKLSALERSKKADSTASPWRHSETFSIRNIQTHGMIVEQAIESYSGDGRTIRAIQYYVIDMEEFKLLKLDDFFANYREEKKLRDIVYDELRKYGKLAAEQPLSRGIFFSNEPELTFNFFITENGLGLRWNPGEIADYAQGGIEIVLPWHIIRPLMLTSGIQLLTKFDLYIFV